MAGLSKYEREMRRRLRNPQSWPSFDQPEFLARLDKIANRALERRTIEGNLAAILVFHQLTEEMLRLLIRDSQFLVQAALLPWHVTPTTRRKQTFGQLQQELRTSVDFPGKERFLSIIDRINAVRIEIVHKLTARNSIAGLRKDSVVAKRLYEQAYAIFDTAHDAFRVDFHGLQKDLM
jgi:hypothetical protein